MFDNNLDLEISRLINAPRTAVWKAWSNPEILKTWWCPRPWMTEVQAFDLRAGGAFNTIMRGPDDEQSGGPGSFLDVVPAERVIFTNILTAGWRPAQPDFMPFTAIITLADEGKGTRYTAVVKHADQAARDRHDEMGFYEGWGICIAQLEEVAKAQV